MSNNNTLAINAQDKKRPQKDKIQEFKDEICKEEALLVTEKEQLGYGDVPIAEFLEIQPNSEDQSIASSILSLQERIQQIQEQKSILFDEEQILEDVSKEPSNELIEKAINRIKLLKGSGDSVSADILEKKLTEILKSHGVKPKTIKELISPQKHGKDPIPSELPFHVLGYNRERKIFIWHKGHLMEFPVSQLRADELNLIVGPDVEIDSLKNQIIDVAHEKGLIDEEDPIKSGVWEINGEWLVVSGRESFLIGTDNVTPLDGPVFQDRIVHFEKNGWVKTNRITPGTCSLKETFESCLTHISQWEWNHPGMAEYVTAFVMLSPFQQAMSWRPWLYVSGPTSCGKSAFFEYVLEQIYGRLIKKKDKATAHSVAQAIGSTSNILILDEFEKNKHIPDILELLKLMSRGGVKASGTPGKNEISYNLHHMPWMASIYPPRTINIDESQRNRMIRFELKKKRGGKSLNILSSVEADSLCANIISSMIPNWAEIQMQAISLEKESASIIESLDGKISGRTVQNFMYASSLLSLVKQEKYTVPDWAKQEERDDGQTIIKAIFNAKTKTSSGREEYLISEFIEIAAGEPIDDTINKDQALDALRLVGLSVVYPKAGGCNVAFQTDMIRKSLLKGDEDFKDLDISAPLERIAGAKKDVRTSWGKGNNKQWCIQIPIDCLFDEGEE